MEKNINDQRNGPETTEQFLVEDYGRYILLEAYWDNKCVQTLQFRGAYKWIKHQSSRRFYLSLI